jgi:hypothetical protein
MQTVAINIDGVIRDFITRFDFIYRKKFIHNPDLIEGNIPTHSDIAQGNVDENSFQIQEEFSDEELERLNAAIEKKEKELLSLPVDTDDLTIHYKFSPSSFKVIQFDDDIGNNEPLKYTSAEMLEKFIYEEYPFQLFGRAEQYENAMETANRIQAYGRENNLYRTALVSTCKGASIHSTYAFLSTHGCRIQNIHFVNSHEEKWELCDILIDDSPQSIHSKPEGKEIVKINRPWNKWDKTAHHRDSLVEVFQQKDLDAIISKNKNI